jgi:23S rRNA pseudouridine2605 synthase
MIDSSLLDTLRLNKHLALQLGISRREADELIDRGDVTINDERATLGARFLEGDRIAIQGEAVASGAALQYIAFNKPIGYVCSRRAQGDRPTIYELLPSKYDILKPVGRLDQNSSGLILLTNDGDFAYRMTHPKFLKTKVYQVQLSRPLAPLHQQMISDHGVQLEDGVSKFLISRIDQVASPDPHAKEMYEVTMNEGRNRQIRRTFLSLGYEVTKLHRTQFGSYSLDDIKAGEFEIVTMR